MCKLCDDDAKYGHLPETNPMPNETASKTPRIEAITDITHRLCRNGMPRDSSIFDLCTEAAAFIANQARELSANARELQEMRERLAEATKPMRVMRMCKQHEGMVYTFKATTIGVASEYCPHCEALAAKTAGKGGEG